MVAGIAIAVFFILIAAAGITAYRFTHPLSLYSDVVKQELNQRFDPWGNIRHIYFAEKDDVKIEGNVNTGKLGEYPVSYSCKGHTYEVNVIVQDTTPPDLKLHPVTTELSQEVKPESFVDKVSDATDVTLKFKEDGLPGEEGTFDVTVIATDTSGNETSADTTLTLVKDTKAPELEGIDNVEVMQGQSYDFNSGVTVKDDYDPDPHYTVNSSQVNFSVPGQYEVTYTTEDRSGNKNTFTRKVTVKEDKNAGRKIVYLTFDDGPSDNTARILDILKKYNAKATFFVTGNNQGKNQLLNSILQQGSAIGLHTYTHDYAKVYSSVDSYFDDLQKISDMVKSVTGTESHIIRFPGGSSNTISSKYSPGLMTKLTKMVQDKGYQYFDWNCDSEDASGNHIPADRLIRSATSGKADHLNILMHDTDAKDTTVQALPSIIEYYRDKGYSFEPLTTDSMPVHHKVNN